MEKNQKINQKQGEYENPFDNGKFVFLSWSGCFPWFLVVSISKSDIYSSSNNATIIDVIGL